MPERIEAAFVDDPDSYALPSAASQAEHDARATLQYATMLRADRRMRVLHLTMRSGVRLAIPADLDPHLSKLTSAEFERLTLLPSGIGLRQDALDLDLTIAGIVRNAFGFDLHHVLPS